MDDTLYTGGRDQLENVTARNVKGKIQEKPKQLVLNIVAAWRNMNQKLLAARQVRITMMTHDIDLQLIGFS